MAIFHLRTKCACFDKNCIPLALLSTFFNAFKLSIDMGRGDARTKRGKISRGSHGKSRPKLEKIKTIIKKQAAAAN
jgi:ribosomal small subunit protein bTHX